MTWTETRPVTYGKFDIWDIQELNWICLAMEDNNNNILNPINFLTARCAYLDHLKTCYYLNNNDG